MGHTVRSVLHARAAVKEMTKRIESAEALAPLLPVGGDTAHSTFASYGPRQSSPLQVCGIRYVTHAARVMAASRLLWVGALAIG